MGKYSLHQQIDINTSFVIQDLPDKPDERRLNAFQVVNAKKSFIVYTDDAATKADWLKSLYHCIEESKKAIAASGASGEAPSTFVAPVWQSDHATTNCQCCNKGFTLFNRRHHCRHW
jgi:hypothetical protein